MHPFSSAMMQGGPTGKRLFLWGQNTYGQLGDGTTVDQNSPIQIGGPVWADVALGSSHSLGVRTDGTLWAWGAYQSGALGTGAVSNVSSPTQVGSLATWTAVWAGYRTSFATKIDGTLWAWGANGYGGLGDGSTTNRSSPVQIGALTNWNGGKMNIMSASAAFIKPNGELWTWGRNNFGQLGRNNTTNYSSPVQVGALTDWSSIGGGSQNSGWCVASRSNGTLWSWGTNGNGNLGLGDAISRSSPSQVGALTDWAGAAISKGMNNIQGTAIVKPGGSLWAMGYNGQGQLGDSTLTSRSSPVQIGALTTWWNGTGQNIAFSQNGWGAAKSDGTLWGTGDSASLNGFPLTGAQSSPVQVGSITPWSKVQSGRKHRGGLVL